MSHFYRRATGLTSPIDRWQDIHFLPPGFYGLHIRVAPSESAGADGAGVQDAGACHLKILFGITPAEAGSTHTFWAIARDFALADERIHRELRTMQEEILAQDVEALETLQEWTSAGRAGPEVSIKNDRGALAARKLLDRLEKAGVGEPTTPRTQRRSQGT